MLNYLIFITFGFTGGAVIITPPHKSASFELDSQWKVAKIYQKTKCSDASCHHESYFLVVGSYCYDWSESSDQYEIRWLDASDHYEIRWLDASDH